VFEIYFQPDSAQGNSGPGATAIGRNGVYETRDGKGATAGPNVVEIIALDGVPTSDSRDGSPLTTKAYRTNANLPHADSEQNFDVPASHLIK
jgi:hypothetical protein